MPAIRLPETSCRTALASSRVWRCSRLIIPIIVALVADADRVVAGAEAGRLHMIMPTRRRPQVLARAD